MAGRLAALTWLVTSSTPRASINLRELAREETHELWLQLQDRPGSCPGSDDSAVLGVEQEGQIHLLVTVSGGPEQTRLFQPEMTAGAVGVLTVRVERGEGLGGQGAWHAALERRVSMGRPRGQYVVLQVWLHKLL